MGWNSGYTVMEKTVVSIHPTQKPIDLYRWIAKEYIEPGWKVLDTYVGSASSLIAYHEAGLRMLGSRLTAICIRKHGRGWKKQQARLAFSIWAYREGRKLLRN